MTELDAIFRASKAHERLQELLERSKNFNKPTPHKRPICGGKGTVHYGFYESVNNVVGTTAHTTEPCRSCKEGIIWK